VLGGAARPRQLQRAQRERGPAAGGLGGQPLAPEPARGACCPLNAQPCSAALQRGPVNRPAGRAAPGRAHFDRNARIIVPRTRAVVMTRAAASSRCSRWKCMSPLRARKFQERTWGRRRKT
jgi:hypothetical protein